MVFILYSSENGLFIHISAFFILCSSEESSFSSRVSARSSCSQSLPFRATAASSLFCERCEISRCRFGACLLSGVSGGRKFPVALIVLKRKASEFWWRKSSEVLDPSVESRTTSKAAVVFTKSNRTKFCTAFERVVMK